MKQLTEEWLKEHEASDKIVEWFEKQEDKSPLAIYNQLMKEKRCSWARWLIIKAKLSVRYQDWYSNGKKLRDCTYKDGELDGRCQLWYDNGQKWQDCTFKDGIRVEKG